MEEPTISVCVDDRQCILIDEHPASVRIDEIVYKLSIYNMAGEVVKCNWVRQPVVQLENSILNTNPVSTSENGVDQGMGYKINRKITVGNEVRWIRANTEQEYIERILAIFGQNVQPDSRSAGTTGGHNFREYAESWFSVYAEPNIEEVTAISYRRAIKNHLVPALGDIAVEDITTDMIQAMFNKIGGAKSSKDKVKIVLNQILETAMDSGLIPKNPLKSSRLRINGEKSKETKPYTVSQMKHLISNLDKIRNEGDRIFLSMIAMHPMRLEEVLGLKWEDVDLESNRFEICRAVTHPTRNQPVVKDTKTESSHRILSLSSIAAGILSAAKKNEGFLLGGETPYSYTQVRKMCNRIKLDTGFDEGITPIRFRTTVLTDIYDQTKDIRLTQLSGGHANSATTLKYYVKGRGTSTTSAEAIDSLYSG